ncbi:MAG TPA: polyprenyl synthetase family protein [Rickettsia endosymbiont of Sericostoma sp.]|uniref:polyprenyl synthetase family protein n=1 Tax=unclassified Candidatus Tisiphia TaxID=2996318 RepID=UPI001DB6F452|nr:polyprenyl synthetase family protein [Rickettsia endosymbiont of Sericostoma sp.]
MDTIKIIHKDLSKELSALNKLILTHLATKEELVSVIGKYLLEFGGKRIRPLLTILTSKMFGYVGEDNIKLAAAVEFIHAATLLHDDVVDESTMRRSKPTANVIWNSKASILVGDFLFSQSFHLMVDTKSIKAMKSLSRASAIISEGEVSQLVKLNQRRIIDETEYNEIIMAKTAELFGVSCEAGAIISNQSNETCEILQKFGRYLGNIFQIIDDLFDYLGDSRDIGKNIGDDFLEGKITLPLIFLYKKLDDKWQLKIQEMIKADNRTESEFKLIRDLMIEHCIKQQIIDYLAAINNEASNLLKQIPIQNIYKDHLASLLEFTLNRSY